jgi:hypothetical protein
MEIDSHPGDCSIQVQTKVIERVCYGVGWALGDQDGVLPSSYVAMRGRRVRINQASVTIQTENRQL